MERPSGASSGASSSLRSRTARSSMMRSLRVSYQEAHLRFDLFILLVNLWPYRSDAGYPELTLWDIFWLLFSWFMSPSAYESAEQQPKYVTKGQLCHWYHGDWNCHLFFQPGLMRMRCDEMRGIIEFFEHCLIIFGAISLGSFFFLSVPSFLLPSLGERCVSLNEFTVFGQRCPDRDSQSPVLVRAHYHWRRRSCEWQRGSQNSPYFLLTRSFHLYVITL